MPAARVLALFTLLATVNAFGLRSHSAIQGPETATAMAGLEGEACPADEYARYQRVVCSIMETCECADSTCTLEWCSEYVHTWKNEFGACVLKGCTASEK